MTHGNMVKLSPSCSAFEVMPTGTSTATSPELPQWSHQSKAASGYQAFLFSEIPYLFLKENYYYWKIICICV